MGQRRPGTLRGKLAAARAYYEQHGTLASPRHATAMDRAIGRSGDRAIGQWTPMIRAAAKVHAGAAPCSRYPASEVGGAVLGVPPPCPVQDLGGQLGEGQRHRLIGVGLLLDGPGPGAWE